MLDRDRGHNAQVGGLTLGLALLGLYALLAISVSWVNSTHAVQGQAEQHAAAQCQEGKDCDEKALRLQARELVTAEATFDLAVYQSIFNFVGLLGLGVTVFYAHKAWREAQRSADTADRALRNLERPWMIFEGATITRRDPSPDVPNAWYAKPRWKNIGRFPAIIDELLISIGDFEELPAEPDYTDAMPCATQRYVPVDQGFATQQLGPGGSGMKDGKIRRLVVYGVMRYRSLSGGKPHETGFSFEVSAHIAAFTSYPGEAYDYHT